MMSRHELAFQSHIIDSYKLAGGYAQKWASEFQAGKPDLVCCLPGLGVHLLEVKHIPEFGPNGKIVLVKNQLTEKQQQECRRYRDAGGQVWAAVVGMSSYARNSQLALFDHQQDIWAASDAYWIEYELGKKFDMRALLRANKVQGVD